jgi:transcriptional regulator with XRE-family HTH domain
MFSCKGGNHIVSEKEWSKKQRDAQLLLAIGNKGKQELAKDLDISRTTLWTWEKDREFMAEVDRIKQENEDFGLRLYYNNLINAVENVKELGNNANNEMVKLNANLEFINRVLGKPSSSLKLTTEVENVKQVGEDILEAEQRKWEQEMLEEE